MTGTGRTPPRKAARPACCAHHRRPRLSPAAGKLAELAELLAGDEAGEDKP
jgi:hypothetical protein